MSVTNDFEKSFYVRAASDSKYVLKFSRYVVDSMDINSLRDRLEEYLLKDFHEMSRNDPQKLADAMFEEAFFEGDENLKSVYVTFELTVEDNVDIQTLSRDLDVKMNHDGLVDCHLLRVQTENPLTKDVGDIEFKPPL